MANSGYPKCDIDRTLNQPGLRPVDVITFFFMAFLTCLILIKWEKISLAWVFLLFHLAASTFLFTLSKYAIIGSPRFAVFLKQWYPVLFILILFSELRFIIPTISYPDKDMLLIYADQRIFGVQPSVFLEKAHNPFLTEILQYVYTSFYFIPLAPAIVLIFKKRIHVHDYYLFLVSYGFFFSYLGYFLIPAIGPRFYLFRQYQSPLHGVFIYSKIVNILNSIESIHRDCFPSGHTMLTLIALHFCWKYERKIFYFLLPIGIALIYSTLYLRYHYGVDLIAGVLFYIFVFYSAPILYNIFLRLSPRFSWKTA